MYICIHAYIYICICMYTYSFRAQETWMLFRTRDGGLGSSTIFKNLMSPSPRRKWYLTTGRRAHQMVLAPIPQPLPVHFFGSRPQPPTSLQNFTRRQATAKQATANHKKVSDRLTSVFWKGPSWNHFGGTQKFQDKPGFGITKGLYRYIDKELENPCLENSKFQDPRISQTWIGRHGFDIEKELWIHIHTEQPFRIWGGFG